jgi:hypothetical protein
MNIRVGSPVILKPLYKVRFSDLRDGHVANLRRAGSALL